MNQINRLLYKANNWHNRHREALTVAFLELDGDTGLYSLACHLWDGVRGSGINVIESIHQSKEEAYARFEELAAEYPGTVDPVCIFPYYDKSEELIPCRGAGA